MTSKLGRGVESSFISTIEAPPTCHTNSEHTVIERERKHLKPCYTLSERRRPAMM